MFDFTDVQPLPMTIPEPVAFFAGVHIQDWTCVRKVKDGPVTRDP